MASWASCVPVAAAGDATPLSYHTPARMLVWRGMRVRPEAHEVAPEAAPLHHWVSSFCQVSPFVPIPLNICWAAPAAPAASLVNFRFPLASVLEVPHWLPYTIRYTLFCPLMSPTPPTPPP